MKNQLKTILLLGALSALLIGLGGAAAPRSIYLFIALALVMNVVSYFFSDRLVLKMHRARAVSPEEAPRLHALVDDLSERARIPKPRVFMIAEPHANAFATGRGPKHGAVAVTSGLMHLLGERELRGVLAHEIAHIRNRDILVATVAAVVAAAITYLAYALQFSAIFGGADSEDEDRGSWAGGLVMALVAPLAATLIQLAISRSREYLADETGARLAGDSGGLADALERLARKAMTRPADVQPSTASLFIVNPLAGESGLVHLFSTHPPTPERVRRLRALSLSGAWASPTKPLAIKGAASSSHHVARRNDSRSRGRR